MKQTLLVLGLFSAVVLRQKRVTVTHMVLR